MTKKSIDLKKILRVVWQLFLVCMIIFAVCNIASIAWQVFRGSKAYHEIVLPAAGTNADALKQLQETNPDIAGWISVEGTGIDFPLLMDRALHDSFEKGEAISGGQLALYKYLFHDYKGDESALGSITTDYRCDLDDPYVIIYGHNADQSGVMFSDLLKFENVNFAAGNQRAEIQTISGIMELELLVCANISGYEGSVYGIGNGAYAPLDLESCLDFLGENALYGSIDRSFSKYVLLSTCYDLPENPERFVVLYGVR